MRSQSPTWAHKAILALLSTTVCLQAGADPSAPQYLAPAEDDQTPMPDQFNAPHAQEHHPEDANPGGSPISYGHCYHLTNPDGEHLGSDGGVYSYLKFGSNNHRRPFRVCKDPHDCSRRGPVHGGSFYLQDYQGSAYAKGKNILAGNYYGYIYPSFGGYTNYLHFKGESDCDAEGVGDCYVRLKLRDQQYGYNGLDINGAKYPYLSQNEQQSISVKFHHVQCPDGDDSYEL